MSNSARLRNPGTTGYLVIQPYGKIEAVLSEMEALHRAAIKLTSPTASVVKLNDLGVFENSFLQSEQSERSLTGLPVEQLASG